MLIHRRITNAIPSKKKIFYKKDRNTLENRQDLHGEGFEAICRNIFQKEVSVHDIPGKFTFSKYEQMPRKKKDTGIQSGTATAVEDEPIIDSNDESSNVY